MGMNGGGAWGGGGQSRGGTQQNSFGSAPAQVSAPPSGYSPADGLRPVRNGNRQITFSTAAGGGIAKAPAMALLAGEVVDAYPLQTNIATCFVGAGPTEAQYGPNMAINATAQATPQTLHVTNLEQIWLWSLNTQAGLLLVVRKG